MLGRKRFVMAVLAFIGVIAAVSEAAAQEIPTLPPRYTTLDENGVDLATGRFNYSREDISVGPQDGVGRLSYTRYIGSSYALLSNWDVTINRSGTFWIVTWNGRTDRFSGSTSATTFAPETAEGQSLSRATAGSVTIWTYTTREGIVLTFGPVGTFSPATCVSICGRLRQIVYPSGEELNLNLETAAVCNDPTQIPCPGYTEDYRVLAVNNNLGFQFKFEYAMQGTPTTLAQLRQWADRTKVIAVNNKDEYCNFSGPCPGTWPTINYSSSRQLPSTSITTTTTDSKVYRYTFDSQARIVGIRWPSSATDNIVIVYDGNSRVSFVTNGNGTWTYSYSIVGTTLTTTSVDPQGHRRVVTANTNTSRPLTLTDPLNRTLTLEYDSGNRLKKQINPEGDYVELTYDVRGNVTQTLNVAKSGSGLSNISSSASYDATCSNVKTCNKPNSTTDPRENVTDYTYDSTHGGVLTSTAPAPTSGGVRPQTRYSYSSLYAWYKQTTGTTISQALTPVYMQTGLSMCQTTSSCSGGADETKTTITYQAGSSSLASNLLPVSVASGTGNGTLTATVGLTFDTMANLLTQDGPLAGTADTTRLRYDSERRTMGIISPDPDGASSLKHRALRYSYSADGLVTLIERGTVNSQSDPDWASMTVLEQSGITYDAANRKIKETLAGTSGIQATIQYSYDSEGRLECAVQRMNPSIFGSLPTSACALGTEGSYGPDRITKTVYDPADQMVQSINGYGTSAQSTDVTATYTANGQVETVADGKGNKTTYEYDGFDRLAKTRFPSPTIAGTSSTTDYEQLGYDAASNVTSRRLRDSTSIAFAYDNLNRVKTKDLPGAEADINYGYDNLSRLTSAIQSTVSVTHTYDALSRQLTEGQAFGSSTSEYDIAGRRTKLTWNDGYYVNYDYDLLDEMTAVRENGATSGVGVLATFAYDNLGNRTGITRGNGTATSYGYDAVSRLSSLTQNLASTPSDDTRTFTYNPASQIIGRTQSNSAYAFTRVDMARGYVTNGLNQYATVTTPASQSVTYDTKGNLASAFGTSYTYWAENALKSATGGITLYYDSLGRLSEYDTTVSTRFVYDGPNMISEVSNPAGTVLKRYVPGSSVDEPVIWYEGAGTSDRRWLHADERGSIVAVSNGSGNSLGLNAYDEYGIPKSTNIGRFQFTGQTWFGELSLYNYKARFYTPSLGRFLQTDPIGYEDDLNLYAYVGNDPINGLDPSGLCNAATGAGCKPRADPPTGTRIPGGATALSGMWGGWASSDGAARSEAYMVAKPTISKVDGDLIDTQWSYVRAQAVGPSANFGSKGWSAGREPPSMLRCAGYPDCAPSPAPRPAAPRQESNIKRCLDAMSGGHMGDPRSDFDIASQHARRVTVGLIDVSGAGGGGGGLNYYMGMQRVAYGLLQDLGYKIGYYTASGCKPQ